MQKDDGVSIEDFRTTNDYSESEDNGREEKSEEIESDENVSMFTNFPNITLYCLMHVVLMAYS